MSFCFLRLQSRLSVCFWPGMLFIPFVQDMCLLKCQCHKFRVVSLKCQKSVRELCACQLTAPTAFQIQATTIVNKRINSPAFRMDSNDSSAEQMIDVV